MFPLLSDQIYRYEHGISAAEQRAADVRAGQTAAALSELWLNLRRAFGLRRRVRPVPGAADAVKEIRTAAPPQALPGIR